MTGLSDRQWWPADVANIGAASTEGVVKLDFLNQALQMGSRPYMQGNEAECGAIAKNGRECLIVWRGKQRAEVILFNNGQLISRKLYVAIHEGEAFRQASSIALAWISENESDHDMSEEPK